MRRGIACLALILAAETCAAEGADPALDALLGTSGDAEYGEYLSSECVTCHQLSGAENGIPSITGWDVKSFAFIMHSYRVKARSNPVMQVIAGRLGDEEIAGLAAYFATLE